nr:fumarylacetoacetate hydrolase family protein [Liberibacter crescens]
MDNDSVFPVRRVYCVGHNYADHIIEMNTPQHDKNIIFFQKNPDNLLLAGHNFPYPSLSQEVHFEVELLVALQDGTSNIHIHDALDYVYGYGVAIDFTRRDLQKTAKRLGHPWEAAKAFEKSAPVSELVPASCIGYVEKGSIWLDVNGERKQDSDIERMIVKTPEIIARLSELFILAPGDVILTGTPSGVGSVKRGDHITCGIEGVATLSVEVV